MDIQSILKRLTISYLLVAAGCGRDSREVVVYCSLDREFAEPILRRFERETGVRVRAKYDVESTKSVALAEQLLREKGRPRADVYWNNEPIHAVRLARAGALTSCRPSRAESVPASCKDAEGRWYGFAARARVLLVNTELVSPEQAPRTWEDLTDPKWRSKIVIAKPLFGTTATQAAWMFAAMGAPAARDYFRRLKENDVQVVSGNKQAAVAVGSGRRPMGLTDTDDAWAEIELKRPVRIVYLEGPTDNLGALRLPNALALVAGAPHPQEGLELIEYLLSPAVESALAAGAGKQIPLLSSAAAPAELRLPTSLRWTDVDFGAVAVQWDEAMRFLRDEFTAP